MLKILPEFIVILLGFYMFCKAADFILGILKAWKNKNYRSRKMRDGIIRWIAELVAILFVICFDMIMGFEFTCILGTLALFIYKEWKSLAENLVECGVEIPSFIAQRLEVFNVNKNNDSDDLKIQSDNLNNLKGEK